MSAKLNFLFRLSHSKRNFILLWGCFFLAALSYPIEAQIEKKPSEKDSRNAEDLREDDQRIKEQRERIKKGQSPVPLPLRYAGKRRNELIFYDIEGQQIYYRYRKDRFDDLAEKKLPLLVKGQTYRVRGLFLGLSFQNIFIPKDASQFQTKLNDSNAILVFQFQSAESLLGERILF